MAVERSTAARLLQAGPMTWVLAAVCGWAVLLWLAALFGLGGRIGLVKAPPMTPLPKPLPAASGRLGLLSDYPQATDRPLFTPDRRPRPFLAAGTDAAIAGAGGGDLDYVLTGTLITPTLRMAIIQPSNGGDALRVREGEVPEGAAGWRLVEVQARRAVFEGGGGQMALDLRTFGADGSGGAKPADAPPAPRDPTPEADASDAEQQADAIRRRIEARRRELQQQGQVPEDSAGTSRPLSGPSR